MCDKRLLQENAINNLLLSIDNVGNEEQFYLFDAHCHLQLNPLFTYERQAIQFASEASLSKISISHMSICGVCPGDDWQRVKYLYENFPTIVIPSFGLHPWWINKLYDRSIDESIDNYYNRKNSNWCSELEDLLIQTPSAGVGECGLDKSVVAGGQRKSNSTTTKCNSGTVDNTDSNTNVGISLELQQELLVQHLRLAIKYRRTLTIHCVSGCWGRLLQILQNEITDDADALTSTCDSDCDIISVILHSCNNMPVDMVKAFLLVHPHKIHIYFSFSARKEYFTKNTESGNVTMTAIVSKTDNLIRAIPLHRLLLETDAPDQLIRVPKSISSLFDYNKSINNKSATNGFCCNDWNDSNKCNAYRKNTTNYTMDTEASSSNSSIDSTHNNLLCEQSLMKDCNQYAKIEPACILSSPTTEQLVSALQYNEPALLVYYCFSWARVLNMNPYELAKVTTNNAKKAFRFTS